jgi:hypothetical protein
MVTREWLRAVQSLANAQDITVRIVQTAMYRPSEGISINQGIPDTSAMEQYTHNAKDRLEGTFDIWCIATSSTWGESRTSNQLPESAAKTGYFDTVELMKIMISQEESYPLTMIPCVALIGSDSRDRDYIIHQEYTQGWPQLASRGWTSR